jgi:hypothetical protein
MFKKSALVVLVVLSSFNGPFDWLDIPRKTTDGAAARRFTYQETARSHQIFAPRAISSRMDSKESY